MPTANATGWMGFNKEHVQQSCERIARVRTDDLGFLVCEGGVEEDLFDPQCVAGG